MDTMCIWNEYICLSSEPFGRIRVHMDAPPDQLRDDPGSGLGRRRVLAYGTPARLDRRNCAEPPEAGRGFIGETNRGPAYGLRCADRQTFPRTRRDGRIPRHVIHDRVTGGAGRASADP